MPRIEIDREMLRAELRGLRKDAVLAILYRAVDLLPKSRLPRLVKGYISTDRLHAATAAPESLIDAIRRFHEASLRGDYYETFQVNSSNCTQLSDGTAAWIAECGRLIELCVAVAKTAPAAELRE